MNDDEQKHNIVKFQIEFSIFFSLFLLFYTHLITPYVSVSTCFFFLQRRRRIGKVGYGYTEPVANLKNNKNNNKMLGQPPSACV